MRRVLSGEDVDDVALRHDVAESTIRRWLDDASNIEQGVELRAILRRYRELERELDRLKRGLEGLV